MSGETRVSWEVEDRLDWICRMARGSESRSDMVRWADLTDDTKFGLLWFALRELLARGARILAAESAALKRAASAEDEAARLSAWSCQSCGARFAFGVVADPVVMSGVKRCSTCVENATLRGRISDMERANRENSEAEAAATDRAANAEAKVARYEQDLLEASNRIHALEERNEADLWDWVSWVDSTQRDDRYSCTHARPTLPCLDGDGTRTCVEQWRQERRDGHAAARLKALPNRFVATVPLVIELDKDRRSIECAAIGCSSTFARKIGHPAGTMVLLCDYHAALLDAGMRTEFVYIVHQTAGDAS